MSLPNRSSASTFGALNKVNYQNIPPANLSTDWDNPSLAQAVSDVAALGLTAPRVVCRLVLGASTGALSLATYLTQWMNATSTVPTLARVSSGVFTITLPTVVSDEYDSSFGITNNITVNLVAANATLEGSTPGFLTASASGNVITVRTFNSSAAANDMVGSTVAIVGY